MQMTTGHLATRWSFYSVSRTLIVRRIINNDGRPSPYLSWRYNPPNAAMFAEERYRPDWLRWIENSSRFSIMFAPF